MMRRILLFFTLAGLSGTLPSQAQSVSDPDVQAAVDRYAGEYLRTTQNNASIFNGKVQAPMPGGIQSLYLRDRGFVERDSWGTEISPRPVPPTESFAAGDLWYDGVKYTGIKMRLDLYRDEFMVLVSENSLYNAILDPERFGYADLRGYRVIYIPEGSPHFNLPKGYYLRLYEGKHDILRKETFEMSLTQMKLINRPLRFYIEKDGAYRPVRRNKGSLLRLFRERRRELDRFIRENGIDVKRNTEESVVRVVQEYERLTGGSTR